MSRSRQCRPFSLLLSMRKSEIRTLYKWKRRQLAAGEAGVISLRICGHVRALLAGTQVRVLHVFLSAPYEVPTGPLIEMVRREFPGVRLAVPAVSPGSPELLHCYLEAGTPLRISRWGVPEPDPLTAVPVSPASIDAVLVPLLAFDVNGNRVGYGGGFYDRFLAQLRPDALKIGLSLFEAIEGIEDVDLHDVRLDYCITAEKIWQWREAHNY